jgi:hypothetical protein
VFVRQDSRVDHDSSSIVTIPAGGGRERVHRVSAVRRQRRLAAAAPVTASKPLAAAAAATTAALAIAAAPGSRSRADRGQPDAWASSQSASVVKPTMIASIQYCERIAVRASL